MISSKGFRPTWVDIDVGAFRHNLRAVVGLLGRSVKILAVLKADAYGHGAVPLARAAQSLGNRLWGFGVSSVEEGMALRGAGVSHRVLILGSLYPFESFDQVLAQDLTPTVASRLSALALAKRAKQRGRPAVCHIKIDTGMGRIGMAPETAQALIPTLKENPWVRVEGVYTHLASADNNASTEHQLKLFERTTASFQNGLRHTANSGAVLARPHAHFDLVRPGLALLGAYPWPALQRVVSLRPVLTWKSRVVFLKTVAKGTSVSYGGTWRASRRSRLATLPVGYADGYRRELSNRGSVLIRGRRCPVAGRVTMDQIVVDVTGATGVDVGEEVVLLGSQGNERVSVEEMAHIVGTIPYDIFCGISKRVPRVVKE